MQGTQDAVQPAKGSGSQTQSDAHSSREEQQPQQPSTSATPSVSASGTPSRAQSAPAKQTNSSPEQSGQSATGSTQQNTAAQNVTNLLTLANLAAASQTAATEPGQTPDSSSDQVASSGKQSGASKGAQSKQAPTAAASTDSALQQALAVLQQVVTVPTPAVTPAETAASAQASASADQAGAQVAVAAALAAESVLGDAAKNVAKGMQQQAGAQAPANATPTATAPTSSASATANTQPSIPQATQSAQAQQGIPAGTTPAAASQFQNNLAATAAAAVMSNASDPSLAANGATQVSGQKPGLAVDQTASNPAAASTFFAATPPQSDNTPSQPSQTTGKVIPFKVSGTNFGSNQSTSSTAAISNASNVFAAKSTAQDASNASSRDGQTGNDANASTQAINTADHATDPNAAQAIAFGTVASGHQTTLSGSSASASDATPSHGSEARGLPSEPANTTLPAGSSAINSARVIQSMNETEMRVGMRSAEFGDISIRTMVTQQQMQAQISVDHSELVSALTAHIPAVQAKIGADYGLHASIEVSQGGASFSNDQGQPSQRDFKPFHSSAQIDSTMMQAEPERVVVRPVAAALAEGSRLDIRA